jgi:chaperonin cofactor prefoldin
MTENLKQEVEDLRKRVAALEKQIQEQPDEIIKQSLEAFYNVLKNSIKNN